jgi:hypothetical protein
VTEIEPTKPASIWKNPSYPRRVHVRERAQLRGTLDHWDERIEQARAQLVAGNSDPARQRLFAQMLGARDQIADAVRRMPMETGGLYDEDRSRLEQAVAALERLSARWS